MDSASLTGCTSECGERVVDTNNEKFEDYIEAIIKHLGENPKRPGLQETPARVVRSWTQLFRGYDWTRQELIDSLKLFPHESSNLVTTPIIVRSISFFSTCEHHMLPFFGFATIVYVPKTDGYIGLSKIPKLVKTMAARMTTQETLGQEIAEVLSEKVAIAGVALIGRHLCMMSRGIDDRAILSTMAIEQQNAQFYAADSFIEILRSEANLLPTPTF